MPDPQITPIDCDLFRVTWPRAFDVLPRKGTELDCEIEGMQGVYEIVEVVNDREFVMVYRRRADADE